MQRIYHQYNPCTKVTSIIWYFLRNLEQYLWNPVTCSYGDYINFILLKKVSMINVKRFKRGIKQILNPKEVFSLGNKIYIKDKTILRHSLKEKFFDFWLMQGVWAPLAEKDLSCLFIFYLTYLWEWIQNRRTLI